MRVETVGVIGPAAEDDLAWHVAQGLRELGVAPVALGGVAAHRWSGRAARPIGLAFGIVRQHPTLGWRTEQHLLDAALRAKVEVVITVQNLHPETVRRFASAGIEVVLWFPDHVANLGALWMFDAPYRRVFFKEPFLVRRVNALLECPVGLLREACNPSSHFRPAVTAKRKTVGVVGNMYATRLKLMERLVTDGFELEVYGNPPPKWSSFTGRQPFATQGYVRGTAKAEAFRNCGVVLNSMHPAEIEGVNNRLFEAAACGGTVLCERRESVNESFVEGSEIALFSDYPELRSHIEGLLADQELAVHMGDRASQRAHLDHTYRGRLQEMFDACGFEAPSQARLRKEDT